MKKCKQCQNEFTSPNPRKLLCTDECHYLFYALRKRINYNPTLAIDIDGEIWVDVNGYVGLYQVSNMGRIKSFIKLLSIDMVGKIRVLSPDKFGYIRCGLNKDNKRTTIKVHRLVAEHFIPNPEGKEQVNHKNMIKSDNRVENLEWLTRGENQKHSYDNDQKRIRQFGQINKMSKLKDSDIHEIFNLYNNGSSKQELSEQYNVHKKTIHGILMGRTWKHINLNQLN